MQKVMKVILLDKNTKICELWRRSFKLLPTALIPNTSDHISIHNGILRTIPRTLPICYPLQELEEEVCSIPTSKLSIVSPGNSFGFLGGGFDEAIRDYFGGAPFEKWFQEQFQMKYNPVGNTTVIDLHNFEGGAKHASFQWIIHIPTMLSPEKSLYDSGNPTFTGRFPVFNATWLALWNAPADCSSIIMPGLGTGWGSIPLEVACESMVLALWLWMVRNKMSALLQRKIILRYFDSEYAPFVDSTYHSGEPITSLEEECQVLGLNYTSLNSSSKPLSLQDIFLVSRTS